MKESTKQQEIILDKEEFAKSVLELMRIVSRSRASSITFTSSEIALFIAHLYEYVTRLPAVADIDTDKLTRALIETRGKYASLQDQARAIKALL